MQDLLALAIAVLAAGWLVRTRLATLTVWPNATVCVVGARASTA